MHRFYMFHSFKRFQRNSIATCALFLAAKVEEQPRKLEHVVSVAHLCMRRDSQSLDLKSEMYQEQAQELVIFENIMLQTLGFEVAIDHPHTHVVRCCALVRAPKDLAQTSYFMATNSLHLTTMCLQYKPTIVACVCIHLACKWAQWEIPKSSEGKEWFWYVDHSVTFSLLEDLTAEFLAIYNKWPARIKRKIQAAVEGGYMLENKLKRKEPSSHSKDYLGHNSHGKDPKQRPGEVHFPSQPYSTGPLDGKQTADQPLSLSKRKVDIEKYRERSEIEMKRRAEEKRYPVSATGSSRPPDAEKLWGDSKRMGPHQLKQPPYQMKKPRDPHEKDKDATDKLKDTLEKQRKFHENAREIKEIITKSREVIEKPGNRIEKPRETLEKQGNRIEKPRETSEKPGNRIEKAKETLEKPGSRLEKPRETFDKSRNIHEKPREAYNKPRDVVEKQKEERLRDGIGEKLREAAIEKQKEVAEKQRDAYEKREMALKQEREAQRILLEKQKELQSRQSEIKDKLREHMVEIREGYHTEEHRKSKLNRISPNEVKPPDIDTSGDREKSTVSTSAHVVIAAQPQQRVKHGYHTEPKNKTTSSQEPLNHDVKSSKIEEQLQLACTKKELKIDPVEPELPKSIFSPSAGLDDFPSPKLPTTPVKISPIKKDRKRSISSSSEPELVPVLTKLEDMPIYNSLLSTNKTKPSKDPVKMETLSLARSSAGSAPVKGYSTMEYREQLAIKKEPTPTIPPSVIRLDRSPKLSSLKRPKISTPEKMKPEPVKTEELPSRKDDSIVTLSCKKIGEKGGIVVTTKRPSEEEIDVQTVDSTRTLLDVPKPQLQSPKVQSKSPHKHKSDVKKHSKKKKKEKKHKEKHKKKDKEKKEHHHRNRHKDYKKDKHKDKDPSLKITIPKAVISSVPKSFSPEVKKEVVDSKELVMKIRKDVINSSAEPSQVASPSSSGLKITIRTGQLPNHNGSSHKKRRREDGSPDNSQHFKAARPEHWNKNSHRNLKVGFMRGRSRGRRMPLPTQRFLRPGRAMFNTEGNHFYNYYDSLAQNNRGPPPRYLGMYAGYACYPQYVESGVQNYNQVYSDYTQGCNGGATFYDQGDGYATGFNANLYLHQAEQGLMPRTGGKLPVLGEHDGKVPLLSTPSEYSGVYDGLSLLTSIPPPPLPMPQVDPSASPCSSPPPLPSEPPPKTPPPPPE